MSRLLRFSVRLKEEITIIALFRSDEMRPEWFSTKSSQDSERSSNDLYPEIPYTKMWETDWVWFPLLLSKKKFVGRADFTRDGDVYKPFRWWYGISMEEKE